MDEVLSSSRLVYACNRRSIWTKPEPPASSILRVVMGFCSLQKARAMAGAGDLANQN